MYNEYIRVDEAKLLTESENVSNTLCYFQNEVNGLGDGVRLESYLKQNGIMTFSDETFWTPQSVNFALWAKELIKRYIWYMQSPNVYRCYLYPFNYSDNIWTILASGFLWGIAQYDTHWILRNPITNLPVKQGSGSDCGVFGNSVAFLKFGYNMSGVSVNEYNELPEYPLLPMYKDIFENPGIERFGQQVTGDADCMIRALGCLSNIKDSETLNSLRVHRDYYNSNNAPTLNGRQTTFEQYPLLNLALYPENSTWKVDNTIYNDDKSLYESLLNSAPEGGPASNSTSTEWTSSSRLIWPWNLGKPFQNQTGDQYTEYTGLDYMMLHNLYYIAFRREDYETLTINNNNPSYLYLRNTSQRAGTVVASCSITGTDVKYTGRKQVTLKPGFSVTAGKKFVANIDAPINNYDGALYKTQVNVSTRYQSKSAGNHNTATFFQVTTEANCINTEISVYPNPCKGNFRLDLKNVHFPNIYSIVNSNGIEVKKGQIETPKQLIDVSSFPKGVYFINITISEKLLTKKIVVI